MKTDFKRPFIISVAYRSGAYDTCSVNGKRASSTSGAKAAAERLAEKLLGADNFTVTQLGLEGVYWEITPVKRDEEVAHA